MAPKKKRLARSGKVTSPSGRADSSALIKSASQAPSKSENRPYQRSSLLALPAELQVEILKYLLADHHQPVLLESWFPPKRRSKRWLKELNTLGVVVPEGAPDDMANITRNVHHLLNVMPVCRGLYQIGNEIYWGGSDFQFDSWRHVENICKIVQQSHNPPQIRHIVLRNVFGGKRNQKFQAPGCLYDLLQAFPRLESLNLDIYGFPSRLVDKVLHSAFHDMHELPHLKSYCLEWAYSCECGDRACHIYAKETCMECIELLALEPSSRKAVFEKAWARMSPYNDV